ncbi:MAG: hypothetical protein HYX87_08580 [Chloroflexi bacterium]|nr:hypothetical protein [Chloroflexota bacterium]
MHSEFTKAEISELTREARIYGANLSEEQFASLMELQKRISDSGMLEAVQALVRLQEERGITYVDALDACEEAAEQSLKLGRQVAAMETRLNDLTSQIAQAKARYEQVMKATAAASTELAKARSEFAVEQRELESLQQREEKEKRRIEKEVADCRQRAGISEEEVAIAIELKASVEGHGFTLDQVLGLSQEFAGHQDAREKLAAGLSQHGSLSRYLEELSQWADKETARLKSGISALEAQKKGLEVDSRALESMLSRLQSDIGAEEELRRFCQRYQGVVGLIDHLARWEEVFFMRCNNPVFTLTGAFDQGCGNARFWTDKKPAMCPQCGYRRLLYDEAAYQALNLPVGAPFRLTTGEKSQ